MNDSSSVCGSLTRPALSRITPLLIILAVNNYNSSENANMTPYVQMSDPEVPWFPPQDFPSVMQECHDFYLPNAGEPAVANALENFDYSRVGAYVLLILFHALTMTQFQVNLNGFLALKSAL